jgi:mono/diheme cytochrome c family protein
MTFKFISNAALAVAITIFAGACVVASKAASPDLGQGWTQADRDLWYEQTQGSRLLPLSWARALEVKDGTQLFFSADHMATYGYLGPEASSLSKFPVGFAIDQQKDDAFSRTRLRWFTGQRDSEAWLGMNCAACHTSELDAGGIKLRIDGGATLADFQTMIDELDQALHATLADPAKFERFAAHTLPAASASPASQSGKADRVTLKTALEALVQWEDRFAIANHGGSATWPDPRYGNGRLDAFGHIFNKVALYVGAPGQTLNAADAPVSYPFLWNTSQSDKVQWNGIAANQAIKPPGGHPFDYGALGRNAGEVTGVFADVTSRPNAGLSGYSSSVQVERLTELERILARLKPPAWPAAFGPIDTPGLTARSSERGKILFDHHCASCHMPLAHNDLTTHFTANISLLKTGIPGNVPPGTDPWMACNAFTYEIATGQLQGTRQGLITGPPLAPVEPTAKVLETMVKGELAHQKAVVLKAAARAIFNAPPAPRPVPPGGFVGPESKAARLNRCLTAASAIVGYKARPLNGVWATAPFLHNGSVPTLYDLLQPPSKRPASFYVGSHRFDPIKVGYVTAKASDNTFRFTARDAAGQPFAGNGNQGHDYNNAALTEDDRWALIAYLKSL